MAAILLYSEIFGNSWVDQNSLNRIEQVEL